MDLAKIGKFIAECRKKQNITQQELADKLGVSDRTIGNWENGRNMPDLSLFKPLCAILNITLNDLLSGEIVKQKEYQEKMEENIVNITDYSNNQIRRIKSVSLIIATIIIILLGTLLVLYGIDINRMRHNKPVFFSTWGFEYVPPINLDYINLESAIKDYLQTEDEKNNYYENEKSFVAMRTYLIKEESTTKYYVYAWVLKEKYYDKNGEIIKDTSSSIPYKFELIKNDNQFIVSDYDIPRDGTYYTQDMKHIFPKSVLEDMDSVHQDGTIEKLMSEMQNNINLYYHK